MTLEETESAFTSHTLTTSECASRYFFVVIKWEKKKSCLNNVKKNKKHFHVMMFFDDLRIAIDYVIYGFYNIKGLARLFPVASG